MIKDYFSLNAWAPTVRGPSGELWLIRADADWCHAEKTEHYDINGWFAVTVGLLGFVACVTYWPQGKRRLQMPSFPFEVGREHGEAGE